MLTSLQGWTSHSYYHFTGEETEAQRNEKCAQCHHVNFFSYCYDKILDKGNLRKEEVYSDSQFEVTAHHGESELKVETGYCLSVLSAGVLRRQVTVS